MRVECQICGEVFTSNRGGQLTCHLQAVHALGPGDYYVLTQLKGVEPVCACGLCDERPVFSRGKFSRYALNHNRFDVRECLYVAKYGDPICECCGSPAGFSSRSQPRRFCSSVCSGRIVGWGNPDTQEAMQKAVRDKYGVDNVSHLAEVRAKISLAASLWTRPPTSDATKQLQSEALKRRWARNKPELSAAIRRGLDKPEVREERSIRMKAQMEDPAYRKKVMKSTRYRLSKLHVRVKEAMGLETKGFLSEQYVCGYLVDEYNPTTRTVLEVFGDYVHANPSLYKPDDVIRLPGNQYTAAVKWAKDAAKLQKLRAAGYIVIVVWESAFKKHAGILWV